MGDRKCGDEEPGSGGGDDPVSGPPGHVPARGCMPAPADGTAGGDGVPGSSGDNDCQTGTSPADAGGPTEGSSSAVPTLETSAPASTDDTGCPHSGHGDDALQAIDLPEIIAFLEEEASILNEAEMDALASNSEPPPLGRWIEITDLLRRHMAEDMEHVAEFSDKKRQAAYVLKLMPMP